VFYYMGSYMYSPTLHTFSHPTFLSILTPYVSQNFVYVHCMGSYGIVSIFSHPMYIVTLCVYLHALCTSEFRIRSQTVVLLFGIVCVFSRPMYILTPYVYSHTLSKSEFRICATVWGRMCVLTPYVYSQRGGLRWRCM